MSRPVTRQLARELALPVQIGDTVYIQDNKETATMPAFRGPTFLYRVTKIDPKRKTVTLCNACDGSGRLYVAMHNVVVVKL